MDCHYVQGNHESGEMSITSLFKKYLFSYKEYSGSKKSYQLLNPTPLLNENLKQNAGTRDPYGKLPSNKTHNPKIFYASSSPETLREVAKRDGLGYMVDEGPYFFSVPDDTMKLLLEKDWDFVEFNSHIAGKGTIQTNFRTHEITIKFKNNYETIPNVSYNITPIENVNSKISCSIKKLDYESVTFMLKENMPDTDHPYIFTWHAFGVVSIEENNDLLLELFQ